MAKEIKTFFSRVIKYSLEVMILSTIIFSLGGGLNLITIPEATAASTWWETAQKGGLDQVGQAYGTNPRDVRMIIVDIIRVILGFLGIIAVVLIFYAGFKWMTAGGNEDQVSDAKKILIAGVIGLIIILSAYIIANFIINRIYGATTGQPVLFE